VILVDTCAWIEWLIGSETGDKIDALLLEAARVCAAHKLATADAIIYATARNNNAELLTCDAHFKALEGVNYVEYHRR